MNPDPVSKNKTIILVTGIVGIVILDAIALLKGINGVIMATSIGTIGALIGGTFGFEFGLKKKD